MCEGWYRGVGMRVLDLVGIYCGILCRGWFNMMGCVLGGGLVFLDGEKVDEFV